MWGGTIFCALLAGFAEVMAPSPSAAYLTLLAVIVVLGGSRSSPRDGCCGVC
ncbi:hypothetical protein [Lentzea nigeriaca]|uniref:hypothetical protein n=1 Tax=Lentzea nigeriaca TaxID=1128665 RepID=UPI00195DF8F8|nr:hypothetical protein [Lentzea nigeriaca]MBM7863954.1 hypothetical protein [Lentzea nigeriaca]